MAIVLFFLIWSGRKRDKSKLSRPNSENSGKQEQPPLSHGVEETNPFVENWDMSPATSWDENSRSASNARWIRYGETFKLRGFSLTGGLFYVGEDRSHRHWRRAEACVIDPSCPISRSQIDPEGISMPYWPAYREISSSERRAYLKWMSLERKDPDIGIGFVFLFFYGLERRLFIDKAMDEYDAIVSEVQRLLDLYGGNHSFHSYATNFLDIATLVRGELPAAPQPSPELRNGYELPLSVKAHIGSKLSMGERLDANDAFLWMVSSPETRMRTPAIRCFDEIRALWTARFVVRFPTGLRIAPPKRRLIATYRTAYGGDEVNVPVANGGAVLPDISATTAPLTRLHALLDECTEDLSSYSRLLGRTPNAKGTVQASLLLPKELLTNFVADDASHLKKVQDLLNGGVTAIVPVTDLLTALDLEIPTKGKLSAGICNQIGVLLEKLDLGLEPDRRYGGRSLDPAAHAVLFKATDGAPVSVEVAALLAARSKVEIAALAALADNHVDPKEVAAIAADVDGMLELTNIERRRLKAYAAALLKNMPSQQSALTRLKKLDQPAKNAVVQSAIAAVMADEHAAPGEIKFLEKLYKVLGLPPEGVYSALHRGSVFLDEPVAVTTEHRSTGVPIPPQPVSETKRQSLGLDKSRLDQIRSETLAVSSILADIFTDEEPVRSNMAGLAVSDVRGEVFRGLDLAHSSLLNKILSLGEMDRPAFEAASKKNGLLPDGAIETINDWAFEHFDEPLIEEYDPVVLAEHLISELRELT